MLADYLGMHLSAPLAAAAGTALACLSVLLTMPKIIRKLRGAGIVGRDVNKASRPEVAEMGGLGVFLAFNVGVFAALTLAPLPAQTQTLLLVSLITLAGATMTGIIDDLVELRQRFKAFIPIVFAAPLALYATDYAIRFPWIGSVGFGLAYVLLVPIGITCASNGFNILEGYNGLGAGLGIVMASALIVLSLLSGNHAGIFVLGPLLGALLGFFWFNKHPASVFPGDTMTLLVGGALAAGAILSKVEFWGAVLFVPHMVEFAIKAANGFPSRGWQGEYRDGKLHCPPRRAVSIPQWVMRVTGGVSESALVGLLVGAEAVFAGLVLLAAYALGA